MAGIRVIAVGATGLPERLRAETADWHEKVEAAADIAGRVRTRADYVGFLSRLGGLHTSFEAHLSAEPWSRDWAGVGVDIAAHCRAGLVVADLNELGMASMATPVLQPFPSFGQALGCLYVLEGSALGGRIVARAVRTVLGAVPTAFLTGQGRLHQWPAVRNALRRFDAQGGDGDEVVAGAVSTFAVFAGHLAEPALQR